MFKLLFWLYIVCYACYIFYSREPDFFDGETVIGKVIIDKQNNKKNAVFSVGKKQYKIDAEYLFRQVYDGENVDIIYLPYHPEKATIYSVWGYWFRWTELLMSSILLFGLYQLSVSITNNPSATAMPVDDNVVRKPKYVD